MSGFKLIAIVPLNGCDTRFRKNLIIGGKYLFCNNYAIELDKELSTILSVKEEPSRTPENLFRLKNGIELNISAVVGENGSGKSTLYELLYYLIYIVSTEKRINNDRLLYHKSEEIANQLSQLKEDYRREQIDQLLKDQEISDSSELIICQLIKKYELDGLLGTTREGKDLLKQLKVELKGKERQFQKLLKIEKRKEKEIREKLAVSILFTKNNSVFELNYAKGKLIYNELSNGGKKELTNGFKEFDFQEFFYNVSINYSIHALNSNVIGNWVSKLFHKNDAYITPVVINPMRDEGNFDINKELHLSKERLMANVLFDIVNDKEAMVLNKYDINRFIFELKKGYRFPFPVDYDNSFFEEHIVGKLLNKKIGLKSSEKLIPIQHGYALSYLDRKIDKIKDQYGFLIYKGETPAFKIHNDEVLLKFLSEDTSHITKKIRQTVNFIKNSINNRIFWDFKEGKRKFIDSAKMIDWIKGCDPNPDKLSPTELIEIALPGFFNVDFEFKKPKEKGRILLDTMSSGEQQMILNINSILYHLYNLQSAHVKNEKNKVSTGNSLNLERVKYENVNISLDEIELYYHPDMQRLLVSNLVKALEKVRSKDEIGIKAINVCFITHSPFILSDIPSQNTLRISNSNPNDYEQDETFGANVHDLLRNDFFLKESFMGEFARGRIKNLIEHLLEQKNNDNWDKDSVEAMIALIGETYLKQDLRELYQNSHYFNDVESIQAEIDRLSEKKSELENRKNNDSDSRK